jgi:hypothetical protein
MRMEHDKEVMFKHRKIEQEEIAKIKTIRASRVHIVLGFVGCSKTTMYRWKRSL